MRVYSDSVLCLGKIHDPGDAVRRWNDQVLTLKMCATFKELQGLDGEPINFEWKIFPGVTALNLLHKVQADLEDQHIIPEKFSDRIIFRTMFNDIDFDKKDNENSCYLTAEKIRDYASKFYDGHLGILGTWRREQVVSRICDRIWWQVGPSSFTDGRNI